MFDELEESRLDILTRTIDNNIALYLRNVKTINELDEVHGQEYLVNKHRKDLIALKETIHSDNDELHELLAVETELDRLVSL